MRVSVTVDINRPRIGRPRRRRLLVGALVAVLLVPATAWASHQFTDVPTGHTFHTDISRAKNAGLTTGCSATTFCPDDPVTRGQMTAFLNRGLGRAVASYITGTLSSSTLTEVGSVTIKAGNPTGGYQLVFITASIHVKTSGTCPCELFAGLYKGDNTALSVDTFIDLDAVPGGGDSFTDSNASLFGLVVVPTGVEQEYIVRASRPVGSASVEIGGRLQAFTVPFGALGDSVSP